MNNAKKHGLPTLFPDSWPESVEKRHMANGKQQEMLADGFPKLRGQGDERSPSHEETRAEQN